MTPTKPHTEITVNHIPDCDICGGAFTTRKAYADARIPANGSWGYLCRHHFDHLGCELGLGKGQKLVLDNPFERLTTRLDATNHKEGTP